MLNRASHPLYAPAPHDGSSAWDMDQSPEMRLGVLYAALCCLTFAVAGRMVYVQAALSDKYAVDFERLTEKFEPIPSRDARILAASGEVFAEDVEVFGLKVHYRWLEEPVDPIWLKQQALSRLDRASRRKPDRVQAEKDKLLAERDGLWKSLAAVTGMEMAELSHRRKAIQDRIERIAAAAEKKRSSRTASPDEVPRSLEVSGSHDAPWWEQAWQTLVTTLMTPPVREATEPLVVQEQLDYHLVFPEVSREIAAEIEAHPKRYPGLRVDLSTRRTYPQGPLAAHVIGYRLLLDADAIQKRHEQFPTGDPLDYRTGDRAGMAGLERYYERMLRGLRGERKLVFNRRGELVHSEVTRQPRDGRNLELTLNIPLQREAEHLLDLALRTETSDEAIERAGLIPQGGSIVAIDVRTGAILAAASGPAFDPRMYVEHDAAAIERIDRDRRSPLMFRVAEARLPPGSVFKALSAVAFLQTGRLDPEREFYCQGYLTDPDHYRCITYRRSGVGHSDVGLVEAIARSCNVYFFEAARRIRPCPITDWGRQFGFGSPTGVDWPQEKVGYLPTPGRTARGGRSNSVDDALQLAIGQGELLVTPLQVARMMAAIANGGRLITPHFVETVHSAEPTIDADGGSESESAVNAIAGQAIPDLSSRTLHFVRRGLEAVVESPQGTGYKTVRMKEVRIAGKTGTAETGGKPDHAWFAGYVPADRPRVAFVVVLEHAGSGGQAAGPVARKFVQAMLQEGLLGQPTIRQLAN